MSNKHIAEWVAALRSGEYKQGQDYLDREVFGEHTFCCLGVAGDLLVKSNPISWHWHAQPVEANTRVWELVGPDACARSGGLPSLAARWLVGDEESSYIGDYGVLPFRDRNDQQLDLVVLNDRCKLNFLQIADVINYAWGGSQDGNVEA